MEDGNFEMEDTVLCVVEDVIYDACELFEGP